MVGFNIIGFSRVHYWLPLILSSLFASIFDLCACLCELLNGHSMAVCVFTYMVYFIVSHSNMYLSVKQIQTHKRTHIYSAQPNILDFLFGNCVNLNLILKFKSTMIWCFSMDTELFTFWIMFIHSFKFEVHIHFIFGLLFIRNWCVFFCWYFVRLSNRWFWVSFEKQSFFSFFHDFFEVFYNFQKPVGNHANYSL